jgi:uncharacterized membrane protein
MQTRLGSLIEAAANVLVGFGLQFGVGMLVLPLFGFAVTVRDNFLIGLIFTAASIARTYVLRRWFNSWLMRGLAARGIR